MTRKTAIRTLLGLSTTGLIGAVIKGQNIQVGFQPPLIEVSYGDQKTQPETQPEIKSGPIDGDLQLALVRFPEYIPGTATLTLNLDGWKGFTVNHGGQSAFISREELWEALKS